MEQSDQADPEKMALALELARQLAHEFGNFANDVAVQIQVQEHLTKTISPNWERIQGESRRIIRLMRQWHRFQVDGAAAKPATVDLHRLIKEVFDPAAHSDLSINLAPAVLAEPMLIIGDWRLLRQLLRLVAQVEAHHLRHASLKNTLMEIGTTRANAHATINVVTPADGHGHLWAGDWQRATEQSRDTWLLQTACQSVAMLVDATIRRDASADGRSVTLIDIPLDARLDSFASADEFPRLAAPDKRPDSATRKTAP